MNIKILLLLIVSATLVGGSSSSISTPESSPNKSEYLYAKKIDSLQGEEFKKVCQYINYEKDSCAINSNVSGK